MMIGPEPIRRIEEMSSRFGIAGEYGGNAVSQVKRGLVSDCVYQSAIISSTA